MSLNVFSFDCVMCHTITQRWPRMQYNVGFPSTEVYQERRAKQLSYTMDDWCVEKHQNYIDMISDNSLKQLVEACLQENPNNRPHMSLIYARITRIIAGMVELMYI